MQNFFDIQTGRTAQLRGRWSFSASGISVALLIVAFIVAGGVLSLMVPAAPSQIDPDLLRQFLTVNPAAVRPEPGERLVYLGLLFSAPVLLGMGILARRALFSTMSPLGWGDVALGASALAFCLWLKPWAVDPFTNFVDLARDAGGTWVVLGILATVAWVAAPQGLAASSAVRRGLFAAVAVVSVALPFAWMVFGAGTVAPEPLFFGHWDAVLYSITQIAQGAVCLHDITPQYGCYGEFMRPIIGLTGLSVAKVSFILASLQALATLAVAFFAFRIIRSPVAAAAACLWLLLFAHRVIYIYPDYYFQYMPLRLLFAALSLLFVAYWHERASSKLALGMGAFAGLGLFWNLDTGAVVVVALGALVLFSRPFSRGRLSLFYAAGVALSVAACAAYLSCRAGEIIDLLGLVRYQRIFFGAGFFMLPASPAPDYWTIAVLATAVTLALYAISIAERRTDPVIDRAAYLAIMGAGLFAYFVGRSHPQVFMLAAWPSVVLVFFLLDRAETACAKALIAPAAALCRAGAAVALMTALAILSARSDVITEVARKQWGAAVDGGSRSAIQDDAAFIAAQTASGETMGLLADNQASLLAEAGRRSTIPGGGMIETVLREDAERTIGFLVSHGPERLFIGSNLLTSDSQSATFEPWIRDNYSRLLRAYAPGTSSPNGRLLMLVRK